MEISTTVSCDADRWGQDIGRWVGGLEECKVKVSSEEEELKITHAAFVSVMHFQTQCQLEANIFSRKKIEVCTSKLLNWQPAQIN